MSNVESQISMALQGLLGNQRQAQVNVQRDMDPRMLQQIMQMEQDQAMGLDKERERLAKEGLRQEKQATLGVMLQDAMARQQAEEAFQRQIEFENMRLQQQNKLQMDYQNAQLEMVRMQNQNVVDADNRKAQQAADAYARQKSLMAEIIGERMMIDREQTAVDVHTTKAVNLVAKQTKERQQLNDRVKVDLAALNATMVGRNFGVSLKGAAKGVVGKQGEIASKVAEATGSGRLGSLVGAVAGPAILAGGLLGKNDVDLGQQVAAAREYSEGISRLMLSTDPTFDPATTSGSRKAVALSQSVQNLLLDAANPELDDEDRLAAVQTRLAEIRKHTGKTDENGNFIPNRYSLAVLKMGLSEMNTTLAQAEGLEGAEAVSRGGGFLNTGVGKMFDSTNRLLGAGIGQDAMDMADPKELLEGVFLSVGAVMTQNDPKTGEPLPMEEKVRMVNKIADGAAAEWAGEFGLDPIKTAELSGMFQAGLSRLLPLDQREQNYRLLISNSQTDEEAAAIDEAFKNNSMNAQRLAEMAVRFVTNPEGDTDATKGAGEAAEGSR